MIRELEGKAKPDAVVPVVRVDDEPERNAAVPGVAAPTAATQNAVRARRRSLRVRLRTAAVITIPVVTPFPHVAAHVVDAKFVGGLGAYRVSGDTTVIFIPSNITKSIAS